VFCCGVGAFQSFVACSLGIGMIGYAMIGYRVSFIVCSLVAGHLLVRCLHRRTIVTAAMLLNVGVVGSWYAWTPPGGSGGSGDSTLGVAALMITWCVLNGAVLGVLRAVFYSLFPLMFAASFDHVLAQAAVWDSLGTSLAYFANSQFCFGVKAGAAIAFTVVAMVTYAGLEYVVARDRRRLRQHGGPSTTGDAAANATTPTTTANNNLVTNVVLDPSMIKQNDDIKAKTSVSLLADDSQITVVPSTDAN